MTQFQYGDDYFLKQKHSKPSVTELPRLSKMFQQTLRWHYTSHRFKQSETGTETFCVAKWLRWLFRIFVLGQMCRRSPFRLWDANKTTSTPKRDSQQTAGRWAHWIIIVETRDSRTKLKFIQRPGPSPTQADKLIVGTRSTFWTNV